MSLMRAKRRVLMMGEDGIVLFSSSAKGVEREGALAWTLPNFGEQLVELLRRRNQSWPVAILFDAIEQTYRREVLPKVGAFDQPKVLRRKLEAAFPTYPVRAALKVPDKRGGGGAVPRGPTYIFAALPDTGVLESVVHALFEAEVPIAGLGLLPVESADLVTALAKGFDFSSGDAPSQWRVLISQHETGGLRQVFVRDGYLVLSRMTQIAEGVLSGPVWVDEVIREFKASLSYLSRMKFSAADGLDVMIVCGDAEKQLFMQKQQLFQATRLKCMATDEAMGAVGLRVIRRQQVKQMFGDVIHAGWLGKKSRLAMPVAMPVLKRVQGPRAAAHAAVGLLILGMLVLGGLLARDWQEYQSLQSEIEQQQNQKALLQREYDDETKVFNELPIRPEVMRAAINIRKMLEGNTAHPGKIFEVVRRVLGPGIVVESIRMGHAPGAGLDGEAAAPGTAFPVAGQAADNGLMSVSFTYQLSGDMTLEQKVSQAEGVVRQLKAMLPGYRVEIVSQFGNVSRTGRFSGKIGQDKSATAESVNAQTVNETAEILIEGAPL